MSRTVSRASLSTMAGVRSALVVISPATTARSVVTIVSQATRLVGSAARQKSRTASLIWSATLSGWPMETDSLVNRYRSVFTDEFPFADRKKDGRLRPPVQDRDYKVRLGWRATERRENWGLGEELNHENTNAENTKGRQEPKMQSGRWQLA